MCAATLVGIEIERERVDVREDRCRADAGNRLGGGVERERRQITSSPYRSRAPPAQHERIGAVRDPDRMRNLEKRGRLPFEGLDLRPEDEAAGLEDSREPLLDPGSAVRAARLTSIRSAGHGRELKVSPARFDDSSASRRLRLTYRTTSQMANDRSLRRPGTRRTGRRDEVLPVLADRHSRRRRRRNTRSPIRRA